MCGKVPLEYMYKVQSTEYKLFLRSTEYMFSYWNTILTLKWEGKKVAMEKMSKNIQMEH